MYHSLSEYLKKNTEAAPLAVFRIFFGFMMLISIIRFWSYGWIEKLYVQPTFWKLYVFDFCFMCNFFNMYYDRL